ncbi:MAG: pyridoxamine 5'-phosphate oxidase family protein [Rhodospirillaceae bacterium]|nr:pyridoxamine 5'-phosphate oxidase family protein [Rhodospirillaceae bacterium]
MIDPSHDVTSEAQLDEIYGAVHEVSLLKEIDHVSDHYRTFIDASPFVLIATAGPEGLDCSPRGDPAGFVRVADPKTLLIPDRRGNNRVDSLRNIVRDPRIGLLFLIPGVGETLRVNGRARISTDPELRAGFEMQGKLPASVIVVAVERVYFQCPKALVRSRLWSSDVQIPRSALPSSGTILQALTENRVEAQTYDAAYPQRIKETIY